jgi:hypothetical protein
MNLFLTVLCGALAAYGQTETLRYAVNWPSGLSLGEATLTASGSGYEFTLEAAVPGFAIVDRFESRITAEGCSVEFTRSLAHGKRKSRERTRFDAARGSARRETLDGGGSTEFSAPGCAHDALAFVFFARRELAAGRIAPAQTVYYGGPYNIRMEYTGAASVTVNETREQADRVVVRLKGPAVETSFEVFFSRDAARVPLVIRAPFALGTFSMELVR